MHNQPRAIEEKLRDGTYSVNYSWGNNIPRLPPQQIRRQPTEKEPFVPAVFELLSNLGLYDISMDNTVNNWQHLVLSQMPDFIHVLSLKGIIMYCNMNGTENILGYHSQELIGQSISAICYEQDVVAVLREMKEYATTATQSGKKDIVKISYRARKKNQSSVWLQCRGRMYSEPNRGRKYFVLVGNIAQTPVLPTSWVQIARQESIQEHGDSSLAEKARMQQRCFWMRITKEGLILHATSRAQALLGLPIANLNSTSLYQHIPISQAHVLSQALQSGSNYEVVKLKHSIINSYGEQVQAESIFYPAFLGDLDLSFMSGTSLKQLDLLLVRMNIPLNGEEDLGEEKPASAEVVIFSQETLASQQQWFSAMSMGLPTTWQFELHQQKLKNNLLKEQTVVLEERLKELLASTQKEAKKVFLCVNMQKRRFTPASTAEQE